MDAPTPANVVVAINASALLLTEPDAVALAMLILKSRHVERDWSNSASSTCRWKYRASAEGGATVELSMMSPAQLAELALKET